VSPSAAPSRSLGTASQGLRPAPRDGQRGGLISKLAFLMVFAAVLFGLYLFRVPLLQACGNFWIVDDKPGPADAIMILGDDNLQGDRATRAAELYRAHWAPRVVASGRPLRPYLTIPDLMRRDLTERARSGKLRPADIAGGTFTISNLGMFGVDAFTAIIIRPQAAILAVGRIADRVVPVDGHPGVRSMMTLTLSCDHRVVDGARAAEFLRDLAEAIGSPPQWLG